MKATDSPPTPTSRRVIAVGRITAGRRRTLVTEDQPLIDLPADPRARRRIMTLRGI